MDLGTTLFRAVLERQADSGSLVWRPNDFFNVIYKLEVMAAVSEEDATIPSRPSLEVLWRRSVVLSFPSHSSLTLSVPTEKALPVPPQRLIFPSRSDRSRSPQQLPSASRLHSLCTAQPHSPTCFKIPQTASSRFSFKSTARMGLSSPARARSPPSSSPRPNHARSRLRSSRWLLDQASYQGSGSLK